MTTTNHEQETAHRFTELQENVAKLKEDVAKRVDSLGTLMKAHPFAALGVGLGLGYLIARIVHR